MSKEPRHEPLWLDTAAARPYPALDRDLRVDVAVIGAGITGLTAAYELTKAGKTVAVLEQAQLGAGTTGGTTAHLTQVFDTGLARLEQAIGTDGARAVWEAGRTAIAHLEATAAAEHIPCHFKRVPGYAFAASDRDRRDVEDEAKRARDLGFVADVVNDRVFPPMAYGAMRVAEQARFHPLKYLAGLAERLTRRGCLIFENSHVGRVHAGTPARLEANGFVVTADHVVFATHAPIHNRLFVAKLAAYQSYAVGVQVPSGTFEDALAWDTEDPYHYWRLEPGDGHDVLIVGGEDHRTGQEPHTCDAFEQLEAYVKEQLAGIDHTISHRWSAQWWEPADGVPFIGRVDGTSNEYIATGFSGNGMTFGPFAGLLITDMILGRENATAAYFDPTRLRVRAGAVSFLTENMAFPTYFAKDWLTPAQAAELEALEPGEGRVVELNGQRVAACRDALGGLHCVSAVCTHMACHVHWNEAETTWDCPCHGSRFTVDGAVIAGPAIQPLAPVQAPQGKEAKS